MSMKRGMRERKLLAESALYFAYKQEIRGNSGGPVFNAAGECCGIAFQGNAVASCSRSVCGNAVAFLQFCCCCGIALQ
eukprot:scaffold261045_cov17-Tisochrysis_lutea.AAC.1